jgi:hypothetical protein
MSDDVYWGRHFAGELSWRLSTSVVWRHCSCSASDNVVAWPLEVVWCSLPVSSAPLLINPTCCTYLLTPWSRVLLGKLTGQEIPPVLWNPKVYKYTPPSSSHSDQSSPRPPVYLQNIHLNIILPSTPGSSKWSFPQDSQQNHMCTPIRATRLAHLILLDLITRTIFGEE